MKSRVLKRIMALGLAVAMFAGDTLPVIADDTVKPIISEEGIWEEVPVEENEDADENIEVFGDVTEENAEELITIEEPETALEDVVEEVGEDKGENEVISLSPVTVNGVTVNVSALANVLPEGVFMEVVELEPIEVQTIVSTITELENEDTEENEEIIVERYKAFDISLYVYDEEGEKKVIEPEDGTVMVTFSGDMIIPSNNENIAIYHVDDSFSSDVEKMEDVQVTTSEEDEQVVEMVTDHFSTYVITITKNKYYDKSSLTFKVVDENNSPVKGARFGIVDSYYDEFYNSGNTYKKKSKPKKEYTTDDKGEITISFPNDYYYTYYYVLKQISTDDLHIKSNDTIYIRVSDETYTYINGKDNFSLEYEVRINDGDSNQYKKAPITIVNALKNDTIIKNLNDVSKTAKLVDWENRIYQIDLAADVSQTPKRAGSDIVILVDTSGSMIFTDAEVINPDTSKIYFDNKFVEPSSNWDSVYGDQVDVYSEAKSRLANYRQDDDGYYRALPDSGSYYFYSDKNNSWYCRSMVEKGKYTLKKSDCLSTNTDKAKKVTDISKVTLYTDRSEVFINATKQFINNVSEDTRIGIVTFGNKAANVTNGFYSGNKEDLEGILLSNCHGNYSTATNAGEGLDLIVKDYFKDASWYNQLEDSYVVIFADGESSDDNYNSVGTLKRSGVEIYSVGLKTDAELIKTTASDENHRYTCKSTEELNKAMQSISTETSAHIKGTMKDEISSYFELCTADGSTEKLDEYYSGAQIINANDNNLQTISWESDDLINVGGTTKRTIYVKAKKGFAGGNAVNTNGAFSVSVPETVEKEKGATTASVNVKADITVSDNETEIFLGENLEDYLTNEVLAGFTNAAETDYLNVSVKWYKDAKHTKEIKVEDLKKETPEEETKYYCQVTVSPKTNGDNVSSDVKTAMNKEGVYYSVDEKTDVISKEAVYTVTVKPSALSFTKKEKEGAELEGVKFTLTRTLKKTSEIDKKWKEEVTSNKDGLVGIEDLDLRYDYTLTEEIPEGYNLAGPWTISAEKNEEKDGKKPDEKYTWTIVSTVNGDETSVEIDKTSGKYTIYNEYGFSPIALASKEAEELSWDERTYKVTLEAETRNQIAEVTEEERIVKPVNVVFLLDASSSMRSAKVDNTTALDKLQSQTKSFIEQLPLGSTVSAVWFSKNAKIMVNDYTINTEKDRKNVLNGISLPDNEDGTRCINGLNLIDTILTKPSYERTYMIFFTDGETYVDGKKQTEATREHDRQAIEKAQVYKNKGVKIYSIGMISKSDWSGDVKNLLTGMSSGPRYTMNCNEADGIVASFLETEVKVGKDSASVPMEADNVTLYDEISEYFDLTDANGNVITTDDEVKAAYGQEASLGSNNGLVTITFSGLSTKLDDAKKAATVSRVIYLKAKEEFAGGNMVPTNGRYIVSVPDPKSPDKVREDEFTHSPEVDVKCEFNPGEAFEEIFLGEKIGDYWKVDDRQKEVENALSDYKTKYSNFKFMKDPQIEWYSDKDCNNKIDDMSKETPEEKTVYYGKVTVSPRYKGKLEKTSVVGTYTVTILQGKVTVTKTITNLSEAEKLSYDGKPIFTFVLKDEKGKAVQTKVITFEDYTNDTKSVSFDNLKKGKYSVEELSAAGWECVEQIGNTNIGISKTSPEAAASFKNKAVTQKAFADKDVVVNSVTVDNNGKLVFSKNKGSN